LADQLEILKIKSLYPTTGEPHIRASHVQAFGDLNIQKEFLSEFMGPGKAPSNSSSENMELFEYSPNDLDVYPARDIPLMYLAQQQKNGRKNNMDMQILLKVRKIFVNLMEKLFKNLFDRIAAIWKNK
jgi:hypothetical protein